MAFILTPSRRQILTSPCELVREVLGDSAEGTFDSVVKPPFTLESAGISDLDVLDKLNVEVIGENATAILGLVRAEGDRSWDEYAFAVAKIYAWAAEEAYRRDRTFGLAASPVDMFASVGFVLRCLFLMSVLLRLRVCSGWASLISWWLGRRWVRRRRHCCIGKLLKLAVRGSLARESKEG